MSGEPPPPPDRLPLDAASRAQMKQWLDNWKRVGPILKAERWARSRAMTDEDAARASLRVLDLWQPDWHGDDGEELLLHQSVFARGRR